MNTIADQSVTVADYWTIALSIIAILLSPISAAAAIRSASHSARSTKVAERQLELVERKIGMVTDPDRMTEIMPVWYIDRMATDYWGFGLLLASGSILAIQRIEGISDDGKWLEVKLLDQDNQPEQIHGHRVLYRVVRDRDNASVRVDQVEAAFELHTS